MLQPAGPFCEDTPMTV